MPGRQRGPLQFTDNQTGKAAATIPRPDEHSLDLSRRTVRPPPATGSRRIRDVPDQEQAARRRKRVRDGGPVVAAAVPRHVLLLYFLDQRNRVRMLVPNRFYPHDLQVTVAIWVRT